MDRLTDADARALAAGLRAQWRTRAGGGTPPTRSALLLVGATRLAGFALATSSPRIPQVESHERLPSGSLSGVLNTRETDMNTTQSLTSVATTLAIACAATTADGQTAAVQWPVADGGNGHWYELRVRPAGITWTEAEAETPIGSHLVAAETGPEKAFVLQNFTPANYPTAFHPQGGPGCSAMGPWIGAYQQPDSPEPSGGWRWVTGEPMDPTDTYCCNNDCQGPETYLHLYKYCSYPMGWNDLPNDGDLCAAAPYGFLVEWEADCNSDGIVDYGQILTGQLIDANANGIPDTCERIPCPGDISGNGAVDGVDITVLLGLWGTDGSGGEFFADVTKLGIVNGADLTVVLGGWGACP